MIQIPPLPERTILLVEVGSTAHGTGIPGGEDHDELAVVVEEPAEVVGLDERGRISAMERTQPEGSRSGPGDVDRTLHSLRRFVRLAAAGNPSILMTFWAPVLRSTSQGESLRALADAFIGRHAAPRYRGYMRSQTERLLGVRGPNGGRPELVGLHGYDTKHGMHAARLGLQGIELLTTGRIELPMSGEPADWLRAVRRGEVGFGEWWDRTVALDARLAELADDPTLPPGPDRARIDAWSVATHLDVWGATPGPTRASGP